MPIINRDLSYSQQRELAKTSFTALATGVTSVMYLAPYPCSVDLAQAAALGVSGSPVYTLWVNRFIPGTGFTAFALGTSFPAVAYGTSGVFGLTAGVSLPQIGSTLSQLQTDDFVMLVSGGANSAVAGMSMNLIIRPLVDIKTFFGII